MQAKSPHGYSIRVTSRLTAIPPETLRMWERRYAFPAPERRDGGARMYTDEDIERLKLVARALKAGYRVGEVITWERAELESALDTVHEPASSTPSMTSLLDTLMRDDIPGVRIALRRAALALGPRSFVAEFAGPLCTEVGERWQRGALDVAREHIFTDCLISQLRVMLAAYEDNDGLPLVVLTTLPGEMHALGLAMTAVYLAASAVTVRPLGPDLPLMSIADTARSLSANVVGVSVSLAADVAITKEHLGLLHDMLPERCHLWVGGAGAEPFAHDNAFEVLSSWPQIDVALAKLRG